MNVRCRPRSRRPVRDGFALLYVLSLLLVASLIAAGLARRSLALTFEAAAAEEELQRRWCRDCLRRALLPRVEELLEAEAARVPEAVPAPRSITAVLVVGSKPYAVTVAAEDAKVNLNTVYFNRGGAGASEVARRSTSSAGPPVRLRPFDPAEPAETLPVFDSWGQVFDLAAAGARPEVPLELSRATAGLTCWGSGRLDLRRAPDEAIESLCRGRVSGSAVAKLLAARREGVNVRGLLGRLALRENDRERLAKLVTGSSNCWSLWIIQLDESHRPEAESELHVLEREHGRNYFSSFAW